MGKRIAGACAGWLLVAVLSTTGCATIRVRAPSSSTPPPCAPDPAVVGTWTDVRLTQLGPAWMRLTLTCDCRFTWRAQVLFGRITRAGEYRAADQVLHFSTDAGVPYAVKGGQLELTEFPGERYVYSRRGARPAFGMSVPQRVH